MKTKFKRIGRQSVSVILAVMMIVSTMLVGMVTSNAAYSAHFYVVGAPVNNSDWTQKSELINNSYGEDSVYYIDIDLTQNTYFALHNGSTQYGPNTDGEEIGLNSTKSSNTYKSSAWKYTGETGKKRIVVNQSSSEWYPSIRIEEIPDTTKHNVTVDAPNTTYSVKVNGTETTSVAEGGTYTFTVAPVSGYKITGVTVAGVSKDVSNPTGSNEYSLTMGTSDVTINVSTESTSTEETPVVGVALLGKTITIDTTSTSNQFTDGLSFVNNQAIIEVSGNSNWFGFVDSNGNYYNVSTNTEVSSGKTYTVNKVVNAPASGCVSWISASTSTFYKLTITEFIPGTSLTYKLEKISTPWRIYGDSTYFSSYGWDTPSSGAPISLSYKGNANQYYYPLEMTAGSTAYFGFYYNSKQHRPSQASSTNMALPTADGAALYIDNYDGRTTGAFTVTADTAGTYYICIDTYSSRAWYEKAVTEPVPVSLTVNSTVEGGNAYISSYTNNDTGSVVTNPSETTVNAKAGTNVSFKADAVAGYYVKWTTSLDSSVATGETFTLTNVTGTEVIEVYATYEQIVNYDVTVKAQTGGSVTATLGGVSQDVSKAISVASNGVITLKAIPDSANNYVFKGWEVNSTNYTLSSGTLSSAEINVTPLGNVTFTATFEVQQGEVSTKYNLMYSKTDSTLTQDSKGDTVQTGLTFYKYETDKYKVTVPIGSLSKSGNNYIAFTTGTGTSALTGMVARGGSEPSVAIDDGSTAYFSNATINNRWEGSTQYFFVYFKFKSDVEVKSATIVYDESENKYTLSAVANILENKVNLYAAKGTEGGNQFANAVDIIDGISDGYYQQTTSGNYTKFRAKLGDKVTVQYTMKTDYANAGYYIYALVVDGKKVEVTKSAEGVYESAPITLTNDKTEVTPVYYNSVIEGAGDYITVYATAPQAITEKWGNTLAIYTWFSSEDTIKKYGDGSYPGQPMMLESNGKYVAKVAKYYYSYDSTNKKVVKDNELSGGTLIKGLLLNSFAENQASRKSVFLNANQQENNQTYDYDDFVKIADMGYDTVQFDIKYASSATTSNQKLVVNNAINAPDKTSSDSAPSPATKYEDLTNIDGKDVSILGYDDATIKSMNNGLTGLNRDQSIKIISVGNQNIYVNGDTWNTEKFDGATQNKWSTIWYVYGTDGKFVTKGLPSDFIPRGTYNKVTGIFTESETQTDAYKEIKKRHLEYTSAQISYEVRMDTSTSVENQWNDDGTLQSTGVRVDGRWYYARSAEKANVEVGIIYKNGDTYTPDTPTNDDIENNPFVGTTTGATASISYSDSNGDHSQIANASVNRNTKVTFTADNSTTYKFIGWSTTNNPTSEADFIKDSNTTITVDTNTKLYAVYEPYASGTLVLNHSKYNGLGANGGVGTYYIKADVYNSQNEFVITYGGTPTDSSILIDDSEYINENSDYTVRVTLYTKPSANSTFESFYVHEGNDFNTLVPSTNHTGTDVFVSDTYVIDPKALFGENGQTVNAVNYYTDLKLPVLASEIVFNYQPYKKAPNPSPEPGKGTGTTNFTITITDKDGNNVTPPSLKDKETSSLTLSATGNIKEFIDNYINDNSGTVDYIITITMKPVADSHCLVGTTYLQTDTGYTENQTTVTYSLKQLYDKDTSKFTTNTVNFYTDFTADEYTFKATFKYNGYDSRKYFDQNGYGNNVSDIPKDKADEKTFTVNQTITGADIDNYLTQDNKLTDQFLIDYAPYEDNFVQTIKWDLENATVIFADSTVSATIKATYATPKFTVTVKYPDNYTETPVDSYTVDYAELVTDSDTKEFLIKASDSYVDNGTTKYFNYWQITNDHEQVVAKCFNTEFNYRVYDNYTITAVYSDNQSASSRPNDERYTTIQFLEYSRNQFDKDGSTEVKSDKVYADFAIAYYYDKLQLRNDNNQNLEVGVVFAFDKAQNSDNNSWTGTAVSKETVENYINGINSENTNLKFINKKIDKTKLDNKNRVEFSWKIDNIPANQPLNLVAYSYIKKGDEVILSSPQEFKFYEVGNQTYKITTNS